MTELPVVIERVMGIFLILYVLVCLLQMGFLKKLLASLRTSQSLEQRYVMFMIGVLVFVIGLFVVIAHPQAETLSGTLTLILGWLLLFKGVAVAALPSWVFRLAPSEKIISVYFPIWGVVIVAVGVLITIGAWS